MAQLPSVYLILYDIIAPHRLSPYHAEISNHIGDCIQCLISLCYIQDYMLAQMNLHKLASLQVYIYTGHADRSTTHNHVTSTSSCNLNLFCSLNLTLLCFISDFVMPELIHLYSIHCSFLSTWDEVTT